MKLELLLIFVAGISAVLANSGKCYRCASSDDYHEKPANVTNLGIQCAESPSNTTAYEVGNVSPRTLVCKTRFIQGSNNADVIVERSYDIMEDPQSLADVGRCHNKTDEDHVLSECTCIENLCNAHIWSQIWSTTDLKELNLTSGPQKTDNSSSNGSLPRDHHLPHNHTGHDNNSDPGSRTGKSNQLVNSTNTGKSSAQNTRASSTSAVSKLNNILYIFLEILLAFTVIV